MIWKKTLMLAVFIIVYASAAEAQNYTSEMCTIDDRDTTGIERDYAIIHLNGDPDEEGINQEFNFKNGINHSPGPDGPICRFFRKYEKIIRVGAAVCSSSNGQSYFADAERYLIGNDDGVISVLFGDSLLIGIEILDAICQKTQ